jgi:hypothetical protein
MDKNRLIEAAEDLRHLRRDWGGKITVEELRRGTPVLRRLLVENHYGNAWRAVGFEKQPTVKAIDLCANPLPADNIIALAWGVKLRGVWVGPAYMTRTQMPQREHTVDASASATLTTAVSATKAHVSRRMTVSSL